MINLELVKDIRESLAARVIGKAGSQFNNEETEQLYHIVNDYIARNDKASVDVKLPFDMFQSLKEMT
ncbi:hypothetical protein D3C78_140040 [compost metagenome]